MTCQRCRLNVSWCGARILHILHILCLRLRMLAQCVQESASSAKVLLFQKNRILQAKFSLAHDTCDEHSFAWIEFYFWQGQVHPSPDGAPWLKWSSQSHFDWIRREPPLVAHKTLSCPLHSSFIALTITVPEPETLPMGRCCLTTFSNCQIDVILFELQVLKFASKNKQVNRWFNAVCCTQED